MAGLKRVWSLFGGAWAMLGDAWEMICEAATSAPEVSFSFEGSTEISPYVVASLLRGRGVDVEATTVATWTAGQREAAAYWAAIIPSEAGGRDIPLPPDLAVLIPSQAGECSPAPLPEEEPAQDTFKEGDFVRVRPRSWVGESQGVRDRSGDPAVYLHSTDVPDSLHPHAVRFADGQSDWVAEVEPWVPVKGERVRVVAEWHPRDLPGATYDRAGCNASYVQATADESGAYLHRVAFNAGYPVLVHAVAPALDGHGRPLPVDGGFEDACEPFEDASEPPARPQREQDVGVEQLRSQLYVVTTDRDEERAENQWRATLLGLLFEEQQRLRTAYSFALAAGAAPDHLRVVPLVGVTGGWQLQLARYGFYRVHWLVLHEQRREWYVEHGRPYIRTVQHWAGGVPVEEWRP